MSCPTCHANPCTCDCSCDPANEAISSAFNNFTSNFFGEITKTCVNGEVLWTLPCDLSDEFTGFPRNTGEPVFCYWWRTLENVITVSACDNVLELCALVDADGLLRNDGAGNLSWDTSDYATLTGVETLTNKTVTNPNNTRQTLTDQANIDWDLNLGGCAIVTLAGNRTMNAPTNLKVGTYALEVTQSGGGNTITWNALFDWAGGTAPTLSAGAGARDLIMFYCNGTRFTGTSVLDIS